MGSASRKNNLIMFDLLKKIEQNIAAWSKCSKWSCDTLVKKKKTLI